MRCSPMRIRNIDCIHIYALLEPTFVFRYFDVVSRHLAEVWSRIVGSEWNVREQERRDR